MGGSEARDRLRHAVEGPELPRELSDVAPLHNGACPPAVRTLRDTAKGRPAIGRVDPPVVDLLDHAMAWEALVEGAPHVGQAHGAP